VRRGDAPATARVWQNARALVVARGDQRLPRFEAARAALGAEGWPVVVRESGGTAVPHGPGVLLLSLAFRPPPGAACTLEATYALLCAPLAGALARLGVPSAPGHAPGSFCDGRFDLLAFGRKIAGTAQRWRAGPGGASPERGAVLCHAALLVDLDLAAATAAVNRFYEAAGSPRRCEPSASIDLREALARAGSPLSAEPDLVGALRAALARVLRGDDRCA
jgi:lipoate-protein ligase A